VNMETTWPDVSHEEIEGWFAQGARQAAYDNEDGTLTQCPHTPVLQCHWWTRGYSYEQRIFRATKAEGESREMIKVAQVIQRRQSGYLHMICDLTLVARDAKAFLEGMKMTERSGVYDGQLAGHLKRSLEIVDGKF